MEGVVGREKFVGVGRGDSLLAKGRQWLRMLVSCRVLAREHGALVFTASDTGTRHGNTCPHPSTEAWGPEDREFKVILHYAVSSRLVWATQDPVFPLPSKKEIAAGRLMGKC